MIRPKPRKNSGMLFFIGLIAISGLALFSCNNSTSNSNNIDSSSTTRTIKMNDSTTLRQDTIVNGHDSGGRGGQNPPPH